MKTQREIGCLPVSRGEHVPGMALYRGNLVTLDGCTYEVIAESTTATPSASSPDFRVFAGIPPETVGRIGALEQAKLDKSSLVVLSQSEYDALATKDDNTFYFITEE